MTSSKCSDFFTPSPFVRILCAVYPQIWTIFLPPPPSVRTSYMESPFCQSTRWAATCYKGFVICFLKVPLACFGNWSTAQQPVELSEHILQNLRNRLPPRTVEQETNNLHISTAVNLIPVLAERLHLELDVEVAGLGLLRDLLDGLLDGVVVDPRQAHLHLDHKYPIYCAEKR